MYTDKVSICIMYTIGMARQPQTLGSWHGHRKHYCESQDTIRHNDRATNWILCSLLPGRDRVLFSSPEHLDWLLRLFRPLFNGVQVQILQQALILTPRPSDRQLWTSKKVCEMAYVSCESAEHIWSENTAQNFFPYFKISARLTENGILCKTSISFFETCFTPQILSQLTLQICKWNISG